MRHPESQRFYQSDPTSVSGGGFGQGFTTPPGATPGENYTPTDQLLDTYQTSTDPQEQAKALQELRKRQAETVAPVSTDEMIARDREMVMTNQGPVPRKAAEAAQGMSIQVRPEGEAALKAQQAQQQGAGGPPLMGAPPMYTTVPGRPGKYSRADVAREAAMAERRKGQMAGFLGAREQLNRDMVQQSYAWMAEAQGEQAAAGMAASDAADKYQKAAQAVNRGRAELDKMQIDPDRYWRNMPSSQKTLMRIGLFFGGLAEGLSGGRLKSAAMQILMAAQNRDMEAQKQNMRKALTNVQMDTKTRDNLLARYDAQEEQRRISGLRVMQAQLSRMGLQEKRLGVKEKYAEVINSIDQHIIDVKRMARGTGGGKKMSPLFEKWFLQRQKQMGKERLQAQKGGAAKGGRGQEALEEAEAIMPDLESRYYNMPKSALLGKFDWTGELQDYERIRKRLSVSLWRMYDSGKLSDKDMEVAMDSFLPAGKWGTIPKYRQAYGKAFLSLKAFLKRARDKINKGAFYSTPEKAKANMRQRWLGKGLSTEITGS